MTAAAAAEPGRTNALVEIKDLRVRHGSKFTLSIEALSIRRQETLTLIGPNGSGKSTLLRTLSLLEPPDSGQVWFDGEPVGAGQRQRLQLRRRMAAVLQEPLLCRTTVAKNVAMGLGFRGLPKAQVRDRVRHWLERLRIDHLEDRSAQSLSGGEAQRTSIARAMVLDPELLLLDEPFSALDPPTRHTLIEEFQDILAETRTTTVFATHDRGEALALAHQIAVIQAGRIAQRGDAEDVFTRPSSEEVARFVGVSTLIPGTVSAITDGVLAVDAGFSSLEIAAPGEVNESVLVSLRPEDITLSTSNDPARTSARNTLLGTVSRIVASEATYRITLDCGVPVVAAITRSAFRELGLEVGQRVTATFKATAAHIIRRAEPGA